MSLRPSLSNLHSSEEKFILIMQANDAPQTSSPEMSWWLCAKKKSNHLPATPCRACLSGVRVLYYQSWCSNAWKQQVLHQSKKTSLNQNNVGRIPIYQHPPSLSKTPATKMFETPRFPPKYPTKTSWKSITWSKSTSTEDLPPISSIPPIGSWPKFHDPWAEIPSHQSH